jgi:quercetin dioxygenase-like cupin family protein
MANNQVLKELAGHNVVRRALSEGDSIQVGPMQLIWKARGPETAYQFSIYELELQPGIGIPLHKHPYAEYFRILSGEVAFAKLDENGNLSWLTCGAGDSVLAPPNTPHTFKNKSSEMARFMSVSTYYHEAMFLTAVEKAQFSGDPKQAEAEFSRFVQGAEETQAYVVEDLITTNQS